MTDVVGTDTMRPRRRMTRRQSILVVLAALAVILFSVLVPIQSVLYGTLLPVAFLLAAALTAAPLLSVSHPRTAIAVFSVAAFVLPLTVAGDRDPQWPWPWSVPALIAFALFVGVVTFLHGWRLGLVPLALGALGSLSAPLLLPDAAPSGSVVADLIVTVSIAAGLYLVAVLLAGRIRIGEELNRAKEVTAQEQDRRILVEERTRIARELHDVVAHSMSLIQVQASTARYRVPELAPDATKEFDDIAATARSSLVEMRRILGVLRTEDHEAELAPQQGIEEIPALVDSVRRAGVTVGLDIVAARPDVPPAVQITAFRLVQEALSNAARHAPGKTITVRVRVDADAVRLRVHNDVAEASAPSGAGHGLRGMRERVTLLDGTLDVGPDAGGGWTVTAELPWGSEPAAAEERQ